MKRILAGLAATVCLSAGLTGCGGGDDSNAGGGGYCDQLKQAQSTLGSLEAADLSKFQSLVDVVSRFADSAPDNVKPAWQTIDGALQEFQAALADAGLKVSDLAGLSSGRIPPGVDAKKISELGTKVQKLASEETQKAGETISADAQKTCQITLGGASSTPSPSASTAG
ncbi:hypothetical protein K8Z61_06005 [Nocardioides sp. TRM66260-LWL]|uniref:hypothetical protein n=1 Tax=Nocardioides sp. TRM66260-LWL TaxID=2874478 RepID=UPI001CC7A368|nr:hypothetical protein [Nocardioides sp. TRM66260-LWL]MBZ5734045.1 hypothetical protein [Nocardioides sp. TRM66260-LWL]